MVAARVITIGASTGGLETLQQLFSALPADLPAAVLIAMHLLPNRPSLLAPLLARVSQLPVAAAQDLAPLHPGHVYIAPPDHHLLVEPGRARVQFGPRENRHRPSIDVLFRSAAQAYGGAAVGVVLSGYLDDGVAGLLAIKAWGGRTVVQEPEDALAPELPLRALQQVPVDHRAPAREIGPLLLALARDGALAPAAPAAGSSTPQPEPRATRAREPSRAPPAAERPGAENPSVYGCPTCGGVLWEIDESSGWFRFRCRVGHAYSPHSLVSEQEHRIEESLWTALRAFEEIADLKTRLADERDTPTEAAQLRHEAQSALQRAADLRAILPAA